MICCTSKTDMERFCRILERFASHLRSLGEETAAEAVETILKFVRKDAEAKALPFGEGGSPKG